MPHSPAILIDLVIITALVCFIPKEVDSCIVDAADLLFILDMLQAVCLVPACGEDIEGDLAANGKSIRKKGEEWVSGGNDHAKG